MRIWLSGPRILGGLVRPGISFSTYELARLWRRGRVAVQDLRREDVVVSRRGSREPGHHLDMTVDLSGEARARLAEGARLEPMPRFPEYPLRDRLAAWVILGFAIYGFLNMLGCVLSAAHAGTCRYYSDGPDSVTACEDGSVIVRHQSGRVDRYGTPNAGFERYPGFEGRPVYERRSEWLP
jgi:hypothetical protein